jgi:DNA ligase (NAD+)
MSKEEAKNRIEQLKKTINYYRYAYHVLDKSLISDSALDSLKKELFDLEMQYPDLITPDSPTQRVGGKPLKEFKKVYHDTPMISFDDAFSETDMKEWLSRLENFLKIELKPHNDLFYCELKIDGLAIELIFENGLFIQGATRGDGLVGEDVTQNLKTIEAIPLKLLDKEEVEKNLINLNLKKFLFLTENWPPQRLVVRGEVFMSKKEFERINRNQEKLNQKVFANPRNMAAGSIRQLDPKVTLSRKLDSFEYDITTLNYKIGSKTVSFLDKIETHELKHLLLKAFGFKTNPNNRPASSLQEVFAFRDYWENHRDKIDYEIDGTVVILNNNELFEAAGVIGKAPRGAIAYKFAPKEATTVVEDIKIQVGRTGTLTPVAVLKPVKVGGITITHATLHNFDQIKRLDVRIGDTVVVSRAGDVIPYITEVLKRMRNGKEKVFKVPKVCPIDGAKLIKEGVYYRCSNPNCGARHLEFLKHFVSEGAFNIKGLGEKNINRFVNEGLIFDAADIFNLKEEDIASLERFGEKSAKKIVDEIQNHKKISLDKFIYSLGILHIGEETARTLAKYFNIPKINIGKFISEFSKKSVEDFQNIPDIGPVVAKSLYDWFHSAKNIEFLKKLESSGIEILSIQQNSSKLENKTFVITGTLSSFSREGIKEKIRSLGGKVSESVSRQTDYVVVGDNPGSKLEMAKKYNIKTLSESEFLKMIS